MSDLIWVRGVGQHIRAIDFLRAALRQRSEEDSTKTRIGDVVDKLRRFFVVVKLMRREDGNIVVSRSDRSASGWSHYQIGYVLLVRDKTDEAIKEMVELYLKSQSEVPVE